MASPIADSAAVAAAPARILPPQDKPIELAFRETLLGANIPWEPNLVARVREYDLLLGIYQPLLHNLGQQGRSAETSNPSNMVEYDRVWCLISKLDELIGRIASTTQPLKLHSESCLRWRPFSEWEDLVSRIQPHASTAGASSHEPDVIVVSLDGTSSLRQRLLEQFKACLYELEGLLMEHAGLDRQITNDSSRSLDMVGWHLQLVPPMTETNTASWICHRGGPEITFGKHERKKVPKDHLNPNGNARGVAKLVLYFKDSSGKPVVLAGSGWLVDGHTVATAGHCVLHKLHGRLMAVDVMAGYETDSRELRRGKHVVVNWGWYRSYMPRHDLAFIRLDTPFEEHTRAIPYVESPARGKDMTISVYGYPSDMGDGKRMHYSECTIPSYDLAQSGWMLEYDLDTAAGNSGGPVFWHHDDGKRTAIGVHWGSGLTKDSRGQEALANKAVIIGREASRVEAFVRVLSHMAGHDDTSVNAVSMALDEEGECQRYTVGGE